VSIRFSSASCIVHAEQLQKFTEAREILSSKHDDKVVTRKVVTRKVNTFEEQITSQLFSICQDPSKWSSAETVIDTFERSPMWSVWRHSGHDCTGLINFIARLRKKYTRKALPATGGNATGKEPSIIVRPEDAADEGVGAREPAHKRTRMIEGAGRESAQGSVSALEKREGGGLQARGAGGKAKRPLNVTLTVRPCMIGHFRIHERMGERRVRNAPRALGAAIGHAGAKAGQRTCTCHTFISREN
jgi:hypothetical protein